MNVFTRLGNGAAGFPFPLPFLRQGQCLSWDGPLATFTDQAGGGELTFAFPSFPFFLLLSGRSAYEHISGGFSGYRQPEPQSSAHPSLFFSFLLPGRDATRSISHWRGSGSTIVAGTSFLPFLSAADTTSIPTRCRAFTLTRAGSMRPALPLLLFLE